MNITQYQAYYCKHRLCLLELLISPEQILLKDQHDKIVKQVIRLNEVIDRLNDYEKEIIWNQNHDVVIKKFEQWMGEKTIKPSNF
jgi:predicted KAP-like P-loop ATPase